MKKVILIVAMCTTVVLGYAQPAGRGRGGNKSPQAIERVHAAKVAYITDKLRLTAEQAGGFVPLYKEYETEIMDSRKYYLKKYKGMQPDNADDMTAKQYLDDNLDYQQAVLDIKRKYKERFLKVLSPQQLTDLQQAEREFRQVLMQRMKERRGQGGNGPNRGGMRRRSN